MIKCHTAPNTLVAQVTISSWSSWSWWRRSLSGWWRGCRPRVLGSPRRHEYGKVSSPRNTNINTNRYVHTVPTLYMINFLTQMIRPAQSIGPGNPGSDLARCSFIKQALVGFKRYSHFSTLVTTYLLWQVPTFSSKTRTLPMQQPFLVSRSLILGKRRGNENIGLAF